MGKRREERKKLETVERETLSGFETRGRWTKRGVVKGLWSVVGVIIGESWWRSRSNGRAVSSRVEWS